jgi:hypothetical protein
MLNKLTIRKQSVLNDLINIVHNFISIGGVIENVSYISAEYMFDGVYKGERIVFNTYNTDEIIMSTDLDIEETFKLYELLQNNTIDYKWNLLKGFIKSEMNKEKVSLEDSCHYQSILNKMFELECDK